MKALQLPLFLWRIWWRYGTSDCLEALCRKWRFHSDNGNHAPGLLTLRDRLAFRVEPKSATTFRYFVDLDPDMWREMDAFLEQSKDRSRFLDVGAHYGVFSLAFAACGGEVRALEPSDDAFPVLCENIRLNPELKVRPVKMAVGNRAGKIAMHREGDHFVASGRSSKGDDDVDVVVMTIDEFVVREQFVPDAIKIDVEGFEVNVLEGAKSVLLQNAPLVFLEVHPEFIQRQGRSVDELLQLMSSCNYLFFDSDDRLIANPLHHFSGPIRRVVCRKSVA